jgi:tRNA nucleotidyltransferase/poly(A) polymerase
MVPAITELSAEKYLEKHMKLLFENWREYKTPTLFEAIDPETVNKIESALIHAGGESYIVGGAVRDELLPDTPPSKDIDFLVRNLELRQIASAISHLGKVKEVGQAFGVVTATIDGEEFDFAIPRTSEIKTGEKHTEFDVKTDPKAPIETDLGRRDFTINALAKDSDGNIIDMFGGQEDLQNRTIRAVGDPNERFQEDPLRMLRAIQFATRFDFDIEHDTAEAIRKNLDKLKSVSGERVLLEFKKAWTKGTANSARFIKLLYETGIGESLFGFSFRPQHIIVEEPIIGNFVAFFLNGGKYEKLKPTNEMIQYLELTQTAAKSDLPVHEFAGDQREKLPLIADMLEQLRYEDKASKIRDALKLPLNAKELEITGHDLMNKGYRGREIGEILNILLKAVHNGKVENSYDNLVAYI